MRKTLTVGELREIIKNIPDNTPVRLTSDTGVDQGEGDIVVESAYRVNYTTYVGETTPENLIKVDYLAIYCNDRVEDEEDE